MMESTMNMTQEQSVTVDKETFFRKLQPYLDEGIVRVVFCAGSGCILAVGELYYMVCGYMLVNDIPFGFITSPKLLEKLIVNNKAIGVLLNGMNQKLKEPDMKKLFRAFSVEDLEEYKRIIAEKKKVDSGHVDVEKERQFLKKRKWKTALGYVVPFLIGVALAVIILFSLIGCKHDYTEEIVYEPTVTSPGKMEKVCKKCKDVVFETIPQLEK